MLLDKNIIHQYLHSQHSKTSLAIEVLSSITSTNDYLKCQLLDTTVELPRACLAEQQTHGRGQLQKNWYSPFGENIYFSYAYACHKKPAELAGFSLVVGLAVIKTLTQCDLHDLKIKWPNDIYWRNQKLAGILVETQTHASEMLHVIIGIGINVNMTQVEASVTQPWTSIKNILAADQDRNKIAAELIAQLTEYLKIFNQQGMQAFLAEWAEVDYLYGKALRTNTSESATGAGINPQGHLLLRKTNGTILAHVSGGLELL